MLVRCWRASLQLLICTTCLFQFGCSDIGHLPTEPVAGSISLNGKPLAGTEIWLVPTSGQAQSAELTIRPYARTKADGTFTLTSYFVDDGAPMGDYAIMVLPPANGPGSEESLATDAPVQSNVRERVPAFPAKYKDPTTSGLSVTVKKGPNQLNLDLKSK